MPASGGSPRHGEVPPPFNGTGGMAGNLAQASLFLLEPTADAAMTYFYGQLFAMGSEIRAMFPAAMDGMIDAAERDAEHAPAWWIGTVTAAEPRLGRPGHLHQRAGRDDRQDRAGAQGPRRAEPPDPPRAGQPGRLAPPGRAQTLRQPGTQVPSVTV